jgi:hypothetical protein
MSALFKHAASMTNNETAVSALRISDDKIEYFNDFLTALDEYRRGIRVDM